MQLHLYSHCAVGLGGPVAVRPPDCRCFSHFVSRQLQSSQSSTRTHVLPSHFNKVLSVFSLSLSLSTLLSRNRVAFALLSLRKVERAFGVFLEVPS